MIGTTAGYVGYDDNSNTLTEKVRRNPYSVILFDEIEKANPQILTLLLQVMDDGGLTDGQKGNVIKVQQSSLHETPALAMAMTLKKRYYARNEKSCPPSLTASTAWLNSYI